MCNGVPVKEKCMHLDVCETVRKWSLGAGSFTWSESIFVGKDIKQNVLVCSTQEQQHKEEEAPVANDTSSEVFDDILDDEEMEKSDEEEEDD